MKTLIASILIVLLLVSCSTDNQPITPEEAQKDLVESRPVWAGQLNVGDVTPGEFLYFVEKDSKNEVVIVTAPYTYESDCLVDFVLWVDNTPLDNTLLTAYCDDLGLIAYGGEFHGWNKYNYVTRSNRPALTPDELNGLIATLQTRPTEVPSTP